MPVLVLALLLLSLSAGDALAEGQPIHSASEIDYPPFCLVDDNGAAAGFSVELMTAALKAMGRDVTFRVGPWSEVRGWLESGQVDALPLVGRTPERESLYDFTFPYMTLHGAIVVREGTTGIQDLEDLRGHTVAVMKGDNAEEFMRREDRGVDLYTTATFDDALRRLSRGEYDAVVIQRLAALRLIQAGGLTDLRILDEPIQGFQQDFCFAVKEGDKDTLELLNEGLSIVIADGTYRHLHAKWFAALELPTDRRIVVGGDDNYPPFEYLDKDGRPAGFNVDLTRAIAQEVGLDIEIQLGPWSEIRDALAAGEIDVLQGMFYSPDRDLGFDFSRPHTVGTGVAVVRKGDGDPPRDLEGLKGMSIVVQQGDIMHDWAIENGLEAQLVVVESPKQALRELSEGRYDCALVTRITALRVLAEEERTNLVVGGASLIAVDYCYAVRDGQEALLAEFDEGLAILADNGEYRRIQEKWLGVYEGSSTEALTILKWVGIGVAPVVVVLLVALLWMWSLRRQVASRTAELRRREEHLDGILRFSADGIFIADPRGRVVRWNPAMEELTGVLSGDAVDSSIFDLWSGLAPGVSRDDPVVREAIKSLSSLAEAEAPPDLTTSSEQEIVRADGTRRFAELKTFPVPGDTGFMFGCVARDVTERKATSAALQEAEERYRVLVESTGDAIFSFDVDMRLSGVNQVAARWFGDASGGILGRRIEDLDFAPATKEAFSRDLHTVLLSGQSLETTVDMVMFDGQVHVLEATLSPIRDAAGQTVGVRGFTRDVTEQKRAERALEEVEEHLRQAQKMEAVGQLAGGIAHDFNNLLTAIIGYSELILDGEESLNEGLTRDIREIRKAAEHGSNLTRQILAFSRKQALRPKVLHLNDIVRGMQSLLHRTLGEEIRIDMHLSDGMPPVEVDEGQIQQALMNLALNARDAMLTGGCLTVTTDFVELGEEYIRVHPDVSAGEYVRLAVTDTGHGMSQELLEHIFEPFFTTKDVGRGTGLGLSTVLGIVKQSGGTVSAYSEQGVGSTFKIYLPPAGKSPGLPEETAPLSRQTATTPLTGGGRILVVEDDPALRSMVVRMLTEDGYEVAEAGNAEEVAALLAQNDGSLDLLLTDVVLPGGAGGREVVVMVQGAYPDVPAIFMSGYPRSLVAESGRLDEGVDYLEKPFTQVALLERVRAALR